MSKSLSWSGYSTYKRDPQAFYTQYIMGIKEPQSRAMLLGDIIHRGFDGEDWKNLLFRNDFTPDYTRIIGEMMKVSIPKFPEQEVWIGEYGREYDETGCCLCGKADGRDKNKHIIFEIKTGSFWTQEKADEHGQLTLYSYLHWKEFNIIPECWLYSFSTSNGKMKSFITKRTEAQMLELCKDIKQVVDELKERGWWENRISSKDAIYENDPSILRTN